MTMLQQPLQCLCSTDAGKKAWGDFFYYSGSFTVKVRRNIESNALDIGILVTMFDGLKRVSLVVMLNCHPK